jgi:hypothetical protein
MELTPYVEELRHQLMVSAEAGGDDARALAERLTAALDSSARLVLLDALSAAAGEITLDLAPGSVDVRLRGRDPEFVVTSPPVDPPADAEAAPAPAGAQSPGRGPASDADEGGASSRITLRLSEQLKGQVEEAAARDGLSVNSWLVRSVAAALDPRVEERRPDRNPPSSGQRFTGWAR